MTKKNAKKVAARTRQNEHGGKYQHHLRQEGGAGGGPGHALEVLLFDSNGERSLGTADFVASESPPRVVTGWLLDRAPRGAFMILEPSGRARHVYMDPRDPSRGPFAVFTEKPDTFEAIQLTCYTIDPRETNL